MKNAWMKAVAAVVAMSAVGAAFATDVPQLRVVGQTGPTYLSYVAATTKLPGQDKSFFEQRGGVGQVDVAVSKTDDIMSAMEKGGLNSPAIAGLGVPSALRMWEKSGHQVAILDGLSRGDVFLYCRADSGIERMDQIKASTKIASPGMDAIQTWGLRIAAQQYLADAHKLDSSIKPMGHPDALKSMSKAAAERTGDDVDCAATSAPNSDTFAKGGYKQVYVSSSLRPFGDFSMTKLPSNATFVVSVWDARWCGQSDAHLQQCSAFKDATRDALKWIGDEENLTAAAKIYMGHAIGKSAKTLADAETVVRSSIYRNSTRVFAATEITKRECTAKTNWLGIKNGENCRDVKTGKHHSAYGTQDMAYGLDGLDVFAMFMFKDGSMKDIPLANKIAAMADYSSSGLPLDAGTQKAMKKMALHK